MDAKIDEVIRPVFVPDKYYARPNVPAVKTDGTTFRGVWG